MSWGVEYFSVISGRPWLDYLNPGRLKDMHEQLRYIYKNIGVWLFLVNCFPPVFICKDKQNILNEYILRYYLFVWLHDSLNGSLNNETILLNN